jgi:hypothetical protein
VLNVHTRVSDLLSNPYDQVREQLRLLIESVKEKQESELLNNADYGLLHNVDDVAEAQDAQGRADAGRSGRVADQGVERALDFPGASTHHCGVWPRVHAPRRASADRVLVWNAVPHLARSSADSLSDKIAIRNKDQKSKILLVRVGEKKQGVVGSSSRDCPANRARACRFASWASTSARWPDQLPYLVNTMSRSTARRWRCCADRSMQLPCCEDVDVANTMSTSEQILASRLLLRRGSHPPRFSHSAGA